MIGLSQSLLKRSLHTELMDQDSQNEEEFKNCLDQLDHINSLTQGFDVTEKGLSFLAETQDWHNIERPIKLLDFGFGSGEQIHLMSKWFKAQNIKAEFHGVELQNYCLEVATEKLSQKSVCATLHLENGLNHLEVNTYDLVTSTLLSHHLTDKEFIYFCKLATKNNKTSVITNDLYRHIIPYSVAKLGSLFSTNRLIRHDAPLSVARSRTIAELEKLKPHSIPEYDSSYFINWSFRYSWILHPKKLK